MNNDNDEGKVEIGSGQGRDWSELKQECLIDILSRLSMEDRWTGPMLVCKPWMNACDDPWLNSVFDLETWFESSRSSSRKLTHFSGVLWIEAKEVSRRFASGTVQMYLCLTLLRDVLIWRFYDLRAA
uniref:Putative F-box/LRR-repeat protein 19 n=1 Tax=Noccaea caerulescens TaxID=107243 RepID=A0A1J3EUA6_NOCCA